MVLVGAGFVLWFTLFLYSMNYVSKVFEKVEKASRKHDFVNSERPFYIAILTEMEEVDEIKKIFNREVRTQGNEKEAICYFKVNSLLLEWL